MTPAAQSPVAPVVDSTPRTVRIVGGRCRVRAATSAPGCAAPRQGRSRISRPSSAAIGPAPIALPTWSSTTRPPRRTSPRKLPLGRARPRLLRPPPSLRPLAAPDRGQPGDRLGPREGAAAGGRRRSPPGCAGSARFASADALQGWARRSPPSPGPSRRDRPPLLARVHTRRDRLDARTGSRGTVNPVSAAAWTRSRQMSWRSVNDGSGAAQLRYRPRPERPKRANAPGPWCKRPTARESGCLGSSGIRGRCWPCAAVAIGVAAVSPPGRALVERVREAAGVTPSEPALVRLPSPGRLVVESPGGPWVVRADGSEAAPRRL